MQKNIFKITWQHCQSFQTLLLDFFGHDLGFKLVFGFGPQLVGPFTTLDWSTTASTASQPFITRNGATKLKHYCEKLEQTAGWHFHFQEAAFTAKY